MSARRLRHAMAVVAALFITIGLLAGCSRKPAPDAAAEDTTGTTAVTGTSLAPPTSDTSSTLAPPIDPTSTTTIVDGGTDAFGHTPEEVAAFTAAFTQAFEAECNRIWASVGGGLLSDPDFPEDQYPVEDCLIELDPDWAELVDSVEEAQASGLEEAQLAASNLADPLCAADGTTCWSYGD